MRGIIYLSIKIFEITKKIGFSLSPILYLYNRSPHSAIDFITYEKAFNKKPDLFFIQIFGARAYVNDENVARGNKVAPRSTIQYLIGYWDTGYITYHSKTNKTNNVCSDKIDERIQYKHDYPCYSQIEIFNFSNTTRHQTKTNNTSATAGLDAHSYYDDLILSSDHGSHLSMDEQPATEL